MRGQRAACSGAPLACYTGRVPVNTQTLSHTDDVMTPDTGAGAYLVLAMDCSRPLGPAQRFDLRGVSRAVVGRGAARDARTESDDNGVEMRIDVDDQWMSTVHFSLTASASGTWVLSDAGSKNGTTINGQRKPGTELADGDVIDCGRSVFVFRDAGGGAARVEPSTDQHRGMATLCVDLERELEPLPRVAASRVSVLVYGQSGTGKEVLAQAIHELSGRSGDLVAINCGALPPTLIESELFGAEKGAFSGAVERREGLVRTSSGGTLFLDEIGELPEQSQATLLRVLQEGEVLPVGATRPVPVDLRVIAATNRDLAERAEAGAFRHDLYARLRGFEIELPPLCERREDIGILVAALLPRLAPERAPRIQLHVRAARALFLHGWQYNVRELAQALESALAIADGDTLELAHLPKPLRTLPEATAVVPKSDRVRLEAALRAHGGNVAAVARELGTSRSQVRRLARRHGIDLDAFR